jgi:hypothetical protein
MVMVPDRGADPIRGATVKPIVPVPVPEAGGDSSIHVDGLEAVQPHAEVVVTVA